jgi:glutamate--cysteine ligase catalytic subunit
MQRAQLRDAARSQKFFFRKNIYALGSSGTPSTASSSGSVSPVESIPRKKERKLRNCFPPIPIPENGFLNHRQSVDQEYEEMSLDEIMNGKVGRYVITERL